PRRDCQKARKALPQYGTSRQGPQDWHPRPRNKRPTGHDPWARKEKTGSATAQEGYCVSPPRRPPPTGFGPSLGSSLIWVEISSLRFSEQPPSRNRNTGRIRAIRTTRHITSP